jgi:PKD repeat protein
MNAIGIIHVRFLILFLMLIGFLVPNFVSSPHAATMPLYNRLESLTSAVDTPTAVATDAGGTLYITDLYNNRLIVFNSTGRYQELTGLDKPISVAVSDRNTIVIGSKGRRSVEVYDAGLRLRFKLGNGNGEFSLPNAIAVDNSGKFYVADGKEDRIKVYNSDGSALFSFGSPGSGNGQFHFPTSIAIDENAGEILVVDRQLKRSMFGSHDGARVQIFDINGGFRSVFEKYGTLIRPMGIVIDKDSRVYITDTLQNGVQVFEKDGTYLGAIYDTDNPMRTPLGMAITQSNKLYVASLNSGSVEIYQLDLTLPDIVVAPPSYDFENIEVGSSSTVTFTVSNEGNEDLLIGEVSHPSLPFSKTSDTCSHQTLAPLETCDIDISFEPEDAGSYTGSITIPSNDPDEPLVTVSLSGEGVIATTAPVADAGGPYTGFEGQAVFLDGSGSTDNDGIIVRYEWDIDNDGIYEYSSFSPTQSHVYNQDGTYTVRLRVTDNLGATGEATATADISDSVPTADFTCIPILGIVPLTVNCSDTSTGHDQPLSYAWDFDNNGTIDSTEQNPAHVYSNLGTYTVKLTVTDSDGSTNSLTRTNYIHVVQTLSRLTVKTEGNGAVVFIPEGNDCGNGCREYEEGTVVTLSPVSEEGWEFFKWKGACTGTGMIRM